MSMEPLRDSSGLWPSHVDVMPCLNPAAQMRKPITIEDHQNSQMIADPFRLLDCSLISDGAAALIVTRVDRARDCRQPPVYILGTGYSCEHSEIVSSRSMTMTAARGAARQAFEMAGISPARRGRCRTI